MPRASLSNALPSLCWTLAVALSACAVASGGPPEINGGGDRGLALGGSFAASGAAGSSVSASGTGLGASGSTSIAGASGTGNGAFGGSAGAGSSGGSSSGGTGSGGTSSAAGAGGKAAAGAGGAGVGGLSGSAGTGSTSCSVSIWSADKVYQMSDKASKNGMQYTAAYYTQNNDPTDAQNCCGGGKPWASSTACN